MWLRIVSLLVLVICVESSGCAEARTFVDQVGREIYVNGYPQRVISLAPNLTETVFDIGGGDLLKGATQYSDHPEAAKKLPRVGSYVRLDVEKIVLLEPDLCLAVKDGNPRQVIEKLDSIGIQSFVFNQRNINDIIKTVNDLGNLLGLEKEAERLVREMEQRLERVRAVIAAISSRPKVFFQIDAAPIITAGHDTFIHELITQAGGINLAADQQGYPRYSWEDILVMGPEVVIIASMAGGHSPEQLKAQWKKWPQIPAVRDNRLHVVEADLIDRPTPRLLDGLDAFVSIIHPEGGHGDADRKK